ncbi:MAG TPA: ATP-dependent dethiobiotin synthetase BioD [Thermoanaerobaculia bacterium]|nr:ATP-dependent dethiobiotin synthetase BioD [Thermoanaerobaculia bacterium]
MIVGTGTDVGKTVVAATLLARYGAEIPLAYWKPVATGSRDGRDTATVEALAGDRALVLAESYLFEEPLSPHLAARLEGRRIEPATLLADYDRHRAAGRTLVIETAGGLLVPLAADSADDAGGDDGSDGAGAEAGRDLGGWPFRLPPARGQASPPAGSQASPPAGRPGARSAAAGNAAAVATAAGTGSVAAGTGSLAAASYLQADLLVAMARRAALSCLVVARSGLGTINHTLLTLEALRARGLPVAGVVLDGPPNRENRLAIQRCGGVETILELPYLAPVDREEVAAATRHFDIEGRLAPLLRLRRHPSTPGGAGGPGEHAGHGQAGHGGRAGRAGDLRGRRRRPPGGLGA